MSTRERPPLPDSATSMHGPSLAAADSPRNRLVEAVRRVSDLVVGRPLPDEALDGAAASLGRVADDLQGAAEPGKAPRGMPDHLGHPQDFFPTSPIIGYANPVAPPVDVWAVEGEDGQPEIRGRAVFGYPYEGPPTCVHGGVIAELFDELLGSVTIITGRPAMTGTLTVTYRRPTPLLTPLDLVARRTRTEGRKVFAWASISCDGQLTAEAEGIFIEVRADKMRNILTANAKEAAGDVVDPQLAAFVEGGGEIFGVDGPPPT